MRGDALVDLGEVLRLAGDPAAAEEVLAAADRLFTDKGNVVRAETVRRLRAAGPPPA